MFGQIQACFQRGSTGEANQDLIVEIGQMLCFWQSRQVRSKRVYGGINSQLEAFIRTTTARQASGAICELLAANRLSWYHELGGSLYWRHESILDKVKGVARGMLMKMRQREGGSTSFLSGPTAERLTTIAVCSSFCITASGFMGRVPLAAQKGDIIAVLAGGKVPFVLREAGRKGLYSIVGDCCKSTSYYVLPIIAWSISVAVLYLHNMSPDIDGIMDGEAFQPVLNGEKELETFSLV